MLASRDVRELDRLALTRGATPRPGARRAIPTRGQSTDFHDVRAYEGGDDPRSIDWTVEARLRQLVVRTFRAEAHSPVHLLLDTSASMSAGSPSKLAASARASAALTYVATLRQDPIGLATFDSGVEVSVPVASGRTQRSRIFERLAAVRPAGRSALDRGLTTYGAAVRGPGLAIVLSDFFDPDLTLDGLRFLLYRGLTPAVIQVVAHEEVVPVLAGDLDLVDLEYPQHSPIRVNRESIPAYAASLARATAELQGFCGERSLSFVRFVADPSLTTFVTDCTRAGLLQRHA